MFNKLKTFFKASETKKAKQGISDYVPQPIHVNAPAQVVLQRAVGRLTRLLSIPDPDQDILRAIEDYRATVANYGHTAPTNLQEAQELELKIRGN